MNKVSVQKSLKLHPVDTYILGIISTGPQSKEWVNIFGEEPAILKNATQQERQDFYENVSMLINNFMVTEYPDPDWKGTAVLYDAFVKPALENVFGGVK
jgi:hypothetical protein